MKKFKLLLLALVCLVGSSAWAQKDVTSTYITNATLSSLTGWTVSNFNTPAKGNNTVGYATEAYAGWSSLDLTAYSLKQTITLPAGNYRLVNYSFFRQGEAYNTNSSKSLAVLKAGSASVAIKTLGSITAAGYANSQAEGANCFDSKMYRNTLDFQIDEDGTAIEIGLEGTFDEMRSWMIAGMFELWDLDAEATEDDPADMTYLITNPGFEYRNATGWTSTGNGGGYANGTAFTSKAGIGFVERWQNGSIGALGDGTFYQNVTVPAGLYEVKVYGHNVEQYNSDAAGTGMYLVADDVETAITTNQQYSAKTKVTSGTLKLGIKLENCTGNWIAFDRFELKYLGVDLEDLKATLTSLISTAQGLYSTPQNADVLQALKDQVAVAETLTSSVSAKAIKAGNEALQNAINNSNASIAIYAQIATLNAKVAALDADAQAAYATTLAAYNDRTLTTYEEAYSAYIAAVKAQTTEGADMTEAIVNWDFTGCSNGNFPGWAIYAPNSGNTNKFSDTAVEYWIGTAANGIFDYYQTVEGLPVGKYTLTAKMWNSMNGVSGTFEATSGVYGKTSAGEAQGAVNKDCDNSGMVEITTDEFTVNDGTLRVGVKNFTTMVARWFGVDWIKLTYVRALTAKDAAIEALDAILTAAEAVDLTPQMNNAEKQALIDAIAEGKALNTASADADAINEMVKKISDAKDAVETSIPAYAAGKVGLDKVADILAETNVYTEAAYNSVYGDAQAAYNAGTWADNDASAYTNATFPTSWHGANTIDDLLLSTWGVKDYENDLYINTWSTEGNTDGSGMTVPFFEYWTNDANTLSANTWTATMTGLEAGVYKVKALVRVHKQNSNTNDPTGITINVNGGASVDVCNGTACSNTQYRYGTYEAYGVVGEDGKLTFNFVIADGTNISWLSFKNVWFEKVAQREVTIAASGYSSFSSAYDVAIPEGIKAYYAASASAESVNMTPISTGKIPANTGVVVKGTAGETYTFAGTTGAEPLTETNYMVAVSTTITDLAPATGDKTNYVLVDGKFCPFTGVATVDAGKAYLSIVAPSDGKLDINWEEPTGISDIDSSIAEMLTEGVYNLNGQKVNSMVKGQIYIVDGKKYMNK